MLLCNYIVTHEPIFVKNIFKKFKIYINRPGKTIYMFVNTALIRIWLECVILTMSYKKTFYLWFGLTFDVRKTNLSLDAAYEIVYAGSSRLEES